MKGALHLPQPLPGFMLQPLGHTSSHSVINGSDSAGWICPPHSFLGFLLMVRKERRMWPEHSGETDGIHHMKSWRSCSFGIHFDLSGFFLFSPSFARPGRVSSIEEISAETRHSLGKLSLEMPGAAPSFDSPSSARVDEKSPEEKRKGEFSWRPRNEPGHLDWCGSLRLYHTHELNYFLPLRSRPDGSFARLSMIEAHLAAVLARAAAAVGDR